MMEHTKLLSRMLEKAYDELESCAGEGLKNENSLDAIDKLTHTIKSITTVLAMEGYDQESSGERRWNNNGRMGRSYNSRGSGERWGYDSGRSRGSDEDFMQSLMELKNMAPDEQTAQAIQRMINERR